MSNIDNIIADIENVNQTYDFWIRDENGNIKDDVVCGEVTPFLEELKDYEIDMSQSEIKDMMNFWDSNFDKPKYERNNTYNYNANIDHDIDYRIVESGHDGVWFAFMVHRYGDVRGNYTDWAVCKFDNLYELWELESIRQSKNFNDGDKIERYTADINIFDECYNVYDNDEGEDVGYFYDIEVPEVLEAIAKMRFEMEN